MKRKHSLLLLLAIGIMVIALLAGCGGSKEPAAPVDEPAQEAEQEEIKYPTRPIEFVVPYAPGGMSDLVARSFATELPEILGQPVVVVNKDGGGGLVGGQYVAAAKPDGYTISVMSYVGALPEYHRRDVPYKSTDLVPICATSQNIHGIAVRKDAPWQNIEDLVEYVRENPGMKYGTTGTGSSNHLAMELLSRMAEIEMEDVPFDSDAAATSNLLGGHIDLIACNLAPLIGLHQSGELRLLAVTSTSSIPQLPDVPSLKEQGYDIGEPVYSAIYAPAGVDPQIIKILEKAFEQAAQSKSVTEIAEKGTGLFLKYLSHEEIVAALEEYKKNVGPIMKELGLID